jgi:hypothetical protein
LGDFELGLIAFVQSAVIATLNGRLMHENVTTRISGDESIALFRIKPLYGTLFSHEFLLAIVSFNRDLPIGLLVFGIFNDLGIRSRKTGCPPIRDDYRTWAS